MKTWTARYNSKKSNENESNYTFANLKDKNKTKHDFIYRRENQFTCKLNMRGIDVYFNEQLQEVALVETFSFKCTRSEPRFLELKFWEKFTENWNYRGTSELAQTLDRFFDGNFLKD